MAITQPLGLWAFLALIPFILLYLRKPKPKDETIPSLMFLVQENRRSKSFSFFQRFTSNLLFFIQLLILSLLAFAIAYPTLSLPYDVTKENTVIIIDASASMQTQDGSNTRFDNAIKEAKKHLSGRNTIILAENTPLIVLEEESTDLAHDVLAKLTAKATTTNLGDALLLANDILGDQPGRIVLISDFLITEGPDVQVVKTTLTSDEKIVDFIDVANEVENTGIIDLSVGKFNSKVFVKNFDDKEKRVTISLKQDGNVLASSGELTISAYSTENFEFTTPKGISTIELTPGDEFPVDDIAYLATPEKVKNSIVLATNERDSNLELALRAAPDMVVHVVNPPVITITTSGEKIDPYQQDAIIWYNVNTENILPGTFEDAANFVRSGGAFVMSAQQGFSQINFQDLTVVNPERTINDPAKICVDTVNSVTKQFEKETCFATTASHFKVQLNNPAISFASIEGSPAIAYKELGAGSLAYYGIVDDASDFKSLPAYPIFWNSLLNFLIGTEDIKEFNYRTGGFVTGDEQQVTTPSSSLVTSKVFLDEQGIYDFSGRKISVNLLESSESEVSASSDSSSLSQRENLLTQGETEHDFSLVFVITFLVFLLMLYELRYIKKRGDL